MRGSPRRLILGLRSLFVRSKSMNSYGLNEQKWKNGKKKEDRLCFVFHNIHFSISCTVPASTPHIAACNCTQSQHLQPNQIILKERGNIFFYLLVYRASQIMLWCCYTAWTMYEQCFLLRETIISTGTVNKQGCKDPVKIKSLRSFQNVTCKRDSVTICSN